MSLDHGVMFMNALSSLASSARYRRAALAITVAIAAVAAGSFAAAAADQTPIWSSPRLQRDCLDYLDYLHWGGSLYDLAPSYAGGNSMALRGHHLYLADGPILVVDVSDPMAPAVVGEGSASYEGVALAGQHAFGIVWAGSLATILIATDISDPAAPFQVGELIVPNWSHDPAASGDYVYLLVRDAIGVVDAADPAAMQWLTDVSLTDLAFVAAYGSGLHVLDLAVPESPVVLASLPDLGLNTRVTVAGDVAYLVVDSPGVLVLDVGDPRRRARSGPSTSAIRPSRSGSPPSSRSWRAVAPASTCTRASAPRAWRWSRRRRRPDCGWWAPIPIPSIRRPRSPSPWIARSASRS